MRSVICNISACLKFSTGLFYKNRSSAVQIAKAQRCGRAFVGYTKPRETSSCQTDCMPYHGMCPFLENGLLNAVDQPQRILMNSSVRCSVFRTGAIVLESC